eukprot:355169-Chlamydomonas_euryale.AAC.1
MPSPAFRSPNHPHNPHPTTSQPTRAADDQPVKMRDALQFVCDAMAANAFSAAAGRAAGPVVRSAVAALPADAAVLIAQWSSCRGDSSGGGSSSKVSMCGGQDQGSGDGEGVGSAFAGSRQRQCDGGGCCGGDGGDIAADTAARGESSCTAADAPTASAAHAGELDQADSGAMAGACREAAHANAFAGELAGASGAATGTAVACGVADASVGAVSVAAPPSAGELERLAHEALAAAAAAT